MIAQTLCQIPPLNTWPAVLPNQVTPRKGCAITSRASKTNCFGPGVSCVMHPR